MDMCFSAQASFTAAAFLLPIGAISVHKALKNNPSYLLLSMIPFIFGLHQIIEGLIWMNIHKNPEVIYGYALAYTLIAFFLWPFFIPLSLYALEPSTKSKVVFKWISIFALGYSLMLYLPILLGRIDLTVEVNRHGLSYVMDLPLWTLKLYVLIYVVVITTSLMLSTVKRANILGLALLFSFLFSIKLYYLTFSSTWCYFSALLSLMVFWVIPNKQEGHKIAL